VTIDTFNHVSVRIGAALLFFFGCAPVRIHRLVAWPWLGVGGGNGGATEKPKNYAVLMDVRRDVDHGGINTRTPAKGLPKPTNQTNF
jgi:hypothetical protein